MWLRRVAVDVQPATWWPSGLIRAPWSGGGETSIGCGDDGRDGGRASSLVARHYVAAPAWYGWAEYHLTPGAWAVLSYRVAHRLWCGGLPTLALVVSLPARIGSGAEIHPQAFIGARLKLAHGCGIVIGATAEIGDDCILLHGVTLGVRHVGQPEPVGVRVHPRLGNRVRIGAGAALLGAITVGDGAQIGANSVVLDDIPAGATAVGAPARIIDHRRSDASDAVVALRR